MTGGLRYVEENRLDENWIERIAQAFEDAGTNGPLTEVQITVGVVKHDHAQVRRLLADPTLTPEQLKAVTSEVAKDPALNKVLAEYTTAQLKALNINSDAEQIKRVNALLEGTATTRHASGELLLTLKAEGLIERLSLSGHFIEHGRTEEGTAYAEGLREVFRFGEPHLAATDPKLSEDYAAALVDNVVTEEKRGPTDGNDVFALSFLLHDSRLSKPFLLSMGAAFERTEQHYEDGSGGWRRQEPVSTGMASLFPPEKIPAIHDPGAFYMSALATNPEAARSFFTGGWEKEPCVQYWVQDRQWGHDGFDGILSAIESATIKNGKATTPESAALVSSMVEYLANRGHETDNFGTNIARPYANNDQLLTGTFGKKGLASIVNIYRTYMPSIDEAVTYEPAGTSDAQSGVWVEEEEKPEEPQSYLQAVISFSRKDFPGIEFNNLPSFDKEDLSTITKAILRTEGGQGALKETVSGYQDAHFAVVSANFDGDSDSKAEFQEALVKDAKLEAFFVQQVTDASGDLGRDRDAAVGAWINVGGDALRAVDIPALMELHPAGRGATFVDFLAGQAIDGGESVLDNLFTDNEEAAKVKASEVADAALANRRTEIVEELHRNGVFPEEKVDKVAKAHGQSPEEVKRWLSEGFSKSGDPSSSDGVSESGDIAKAEVVRNRTTKDSYGRILTQLRAELPEFREYEQIYIDGFKSARK